MAERLNAHDSKSCYAGMYTRVQIPLSAPRNKDRHFCLSLFHCFYERDLRGEPRTRVSALPYDFWRTIRLKAKAQLIIAERGAPLKAQIPFSAPRNKDRHFCLSLFHCLYERDLNPCIIET